MPNYRALLTRLHTSDLLAWEDMDPVTAREVREALDDEPEPTTTTTDGKLLPCPFCGSTDVAALTNPYVRCMACDAFGPTGMRDADGLALWNTRAALSDSTPSPAPSVDSGAEPARGEAVSARACWDCAHSRDDHRRCVAAVAATCAAWIGENSDDQNEWRPLPGARNCPGWAPREAGEAPHE